MKSEASADTQSPPQKKGYGGDDIDSVILNGITFRGKGKSSMDNGQSDKVMTKAKKKQYITGAHGSASAKKKADIRRKRANRHK